MNFEALLSWSYYVETNPGGDFLFGYGFLAFFLFVLFYKKILLAVGPKNKYMKKSMKKRFWKFSLFGGLGLLLVLCRFAAIPYFSMRLWLFLVFLVTLITLLKTSWDVFQQYQKRLQSVEREKH